MPSPAFDTHAEIRKLQEAGCAEEQAEAMVDLVSRTPTDPQVFKRFDDVDKRFDDVYKRFDDVDKRFDGLETRLDRFESSVDVRFERLDIRYEKLDGRIDNLESRLSVIEKNMVTKADLAQLYKYLLLGGVGLASFIFAVVTLS